MRVVRLYDTPEKEAIMEATQPGYNFIQFLAFLWLFPLPIVGLVTVAYLGARYFGLV